MKDSKLTSNFGDRQDFSGREHNQVEIAKKIGQITDKSTIFTDARKRPNEL
jgi:hypothetical protein